jgi:diguanylate cyclase (GGDEF)-like protein
LLLSGINLSSLPLKLPARAGAQGRMTMKKKKSTAQSQTRRLVAAGLIICLGFIAICWGILAEMAERDRASAKAAATNVVATISADIARNIELYDLSLQAVEEGLRIPNFYLIPPDARQLILFDRAATARDLGGMLAVDRNGNVIADSQSTAHNDKNYSEREYFVFHRNNLTTRHHISPPEVNRRGEYLIHISRAMTDANGQFSGVVVGTLRLTYFHNLFRNVKIGSDDALSISHETGSLIMRLPFDIGLIGRDVKNTDVFRNISNSASGSFEATAGLDGVKRLYVFQNVEGTPLKIVHGISINVIYADWWKLAIWIGLVVAALCAVNMTMMVFLAISIRKRAAAEQALHQLATIDGLTGLANRRSFDEVFAKEWARAYRSGASVALLMIDADNFKSYNDRFGHQAGDVALKTIADCISTVSRRSRDLAARYGGEEFVVVLPETTAVEAAMIAEKIRSHVLDLRSQQQNRLDSTPTISIGVSAIMPRVGLETRDLLKAADSALYLAKEQGRNRCVVATNQPSESMRSAA